MFITSLNESMSVKEERTNQYRHNATYHKGNPIGNLVQITFIWFPSKTKEFLWISDDIESAISLKTFLLIFVSMPTIFPDA
jgi:hypothetical protein